MSALFPGIIISPFSSLIGFSRSGFGNSTTSGCYKNKQANNNWILSATTVSKQLRPAGRNLNAPRTYSRSACLPYVEVSSLRNSTSAGLLTLNAVMSRIHARNTRAITVDYLPPVQVVVLFCRPWLCWLSFLYQRSCWEFPWRQLKEKRKHILNFWPEITRALHAK